MIYLACISTILAIIGWVILAFVYFRKKKEVELYETTEMVYADHKFKVINPSELSKARQLAIARGEYERQWGIDKKDLLTFLHYVSEKSDSPKVTYHIAETLIKLIQEDHQYMPFLRAACFMIVLDDEDPKKIDYRANEKKIELCLNSNEVLSFFLSNIYAFTTNMEASSIISRVSELLGEAWRLDMEKVIYSQLAEIRVSNGQTSKK